MKLIRAGRTLGFGVLTEIDVRATLRERLGEHMEDFITLGACNPLLAHRALQADRQIGMLLPRSVAVRADGDQTIVEALDPAVMVRVTGRDELGPVAPILPAPAGGMTGRAATPVRPAAQAPDSPGRGAGRVSSQRLSAAFSVARHSAGLS